jgi:hypothetical protein
MRDSFTIARTITASLAISILFTSLSYGGKPATRPVLAPPPSYADVADRALASDIVASAVVSKASRLDQKRFSGLPSGTERVLLDVRITTLIRGPLGQAQDVQFLADITLDTKGRLPKLRKQPLLIFADQVAGATGQVQLLDRYAVLPWSLEIETLARNILIAAQAPSAAPRIKGIGHVFSVAGSVPGENETQIFLESENGRPVSLSVLRRPGEQPRWMVSLDEIVDEAAADPAPGSLTWYRLACALPSTLPASATAGMEPAAAETALQDFGLIIEQLGTCSRTVPPLAAAAR